MIEVRRDSSRLKISVRNDRTTANPQPPRYDRTMDLTVYTAFWCRDCREAKNLLKKHNIPFREIDIENTPGAADELVQNVGKRAIPQFVIDGKWIQPYRPGHGFLYKEMSALLGVSE